MMKTAIVWFFLFSQVLFSQEFGSLPNRADIDRILAVPDKSDRLMQLHDYFLMLQDNNPDLKLPQQLLAHAREMKDVELEAFALSQIGFQCYIVANNAKALEYNLTAWQMVESSDNALLRAMIKNRLSVSYVKTPKKAIPLYKEAMADAVKANYGNLTPIISSNIGRNYLRLKNIDSALYFLQQAEQLHRKAKLKNTMCFTLSSLGDVYAELNQPNLAIAYYHSSIAEALRGKSPRFINNSYTAIAQFYYDRKQIDSSAFYAKKAIDVVENTAFSTRIVIPSGILRNIYRGKDDALAMKYSDMFIKANDSVNSIRAAQQMEMLTFDAEMKQREIDDEKIKLEEQRKQTLQYALIGVGIFILLTLYLLLSRSFITNTKIIEFFGIIALLIVFEFLNLLLHPFIAKITHHSPILMLLAMVCIAALLVPLHHKIEHWATNKLIEKNKAIRLANAKKTIEQLEEKS